MTNQAYLHRAFLAWLRSGRAGVTYALPAESCAAHVTLPNGKEYVVLANGFRVLGVYRVRTSGMLRLLKRWPKAVEEAVGLARD